MASTQIRDRTRVHHGSGSGDVFVCSRSSADLRAKIRTADGALTKRAGSDTDASLCEEVHNDGVMEV